MTIAFAKIPSGIRVPGTYFEFSPVAASGAQGLRTLIIGQVLAGTPYAAAGVVGTPQITLGGADARTNAGAGSMLALMVAQHRARYATGELWVLPLADDGSAAAATGTIVFTGPATVAGTLPLYINGTSVPVAVTSGMTAAQIATAVAGVVSSPTYADLPVTAASSTGTVTFTAKNKGLAGNDIDVRLAYQGAANGESTPAGIGATITAMSGGTVNPVLTTPMLNLGDMRFEVILSPYTDATSLDALGVAMDDNTGRWSPTRKLWGHVYAAKAANLSAAVTFGSGRNDKHVTVMPINSSPLWPPQVVADYGAAVIERVAADPALPLQFLPTNIPPPVPSARFVAVDRDTLLHDGLSTYKVVGGQVQVERLVTTYQTNGAGAADTSYLNAEAMHILSAHARDFDAYFSAMIAQGLKLAVDGTPAPGGSRIITPAVVKATMDGRYRYQCEVLGWCQDPDGYARESRVELAGNGRLNVYDPVRLMGQLRIMAFQVNFSQPT